MNKIYSGSSSINKKSFIKYLGVALFGLLIDYLTLIFAKEVLDLHYLVAACIGFISGLTVNYLLSSRYVFSNPKIESRIINFLLFGLIGLVGLALLNLTMYGLVQFIGINYLFAKTFATIIVYFWNYLARAKLYSGS